MRLISVSDMKELEKNANDAGFTYAEMMQTAGKGIADYLVSQYGGTGINTAIGLVGKGNNGGDTVIALAGLQKSGWTTRALLVGERGKQDPLLMDYLAIGGMVVDADDIPMINREAGGRGVVLDGVYGTGFHPPLPDRIVGIFRTARESLPGFDWVAVDCPSGVDCENGIVSDGTMHVKKSLSLGAVKFGMLSAEAFPYCGELVVIDIGLSKFDATSGEMIDLVIDEQYCRDVLPKRTAFSHKGTYGKTLIIGGSVNYPGAPVLAGKAAYTVGTGLVQVAVPESIGQISPAGNPDLTWLILEDGGGIISEQAANTAIEHIPSAQSLVLGPGMGRESSTTKFLTRLLFESARNHQPHTGFPGMGSKVTSTPISSDWPPIVLDADGLFHLAQDNHWQEKVSAKLVLTPHPGEMALLTGLSVEEIQADRIGVAREWAQKWGQIVVLKGALTVIANPDGRVGVVPVATSSLAKAGTGDVLAGMIGGLLAQSLDPWRAVAAGAYLHARAGLCAEELIGCSESVTASDVIRAIPRVYWKLKSNDLP